MTEKKHLTHGLIPVVEKKLQLVPKNNLLRTLDLLLVPSSIIRNTRHELKKQCIDYSFEKNSSLYALETAVEALRVWYYLYNIF